MKTLIQILTALLIVVLIIGSTSCSRKVGCYYALESDRQTIHPALTQTIDDSAVNDATTNTCE